VSEIDFSGLLVAPERRIDMHIRFLLALLLTAAAAAVLAAPDMAARATTRPTVVVRSSEYGRILFDGGNRALYAFTHDAREKATCYGACAKAWPPYIVRGTLRAGAGTSQAKLGTTRRRDGRRQLTYAGRPLYYYVNDRRGEVRCQNVSEYGGLWLVVRASGRLVR
jgi:predicted lipoprotein with Yx(FWY)xxD motif